MGSHAITFVTSFFDIGRITNAPLQKFDNYFTWIEDLLKLPINIYFFTTQELHDKIKYIPRDNLKFKIINEIPYFDKLPQIEKIWSHYNTNNPDKDTAKFACIMHAKFVFVQQAISDNPFGKGCEASSTGSDRVTLGKSNEVASSECGEAASRDDYYAWIDAGLLKNATNPELLLTLVPSNKIRCIMLNYIGKDEILNPEFINTCRYKISGNLLIGPKHIMNTFTTQMIQRAEDDINHGRFGLEQEYIAILYRNNPDMFDPYYGDFCDVILNYYECQRTFWLVMRVLTDAIIHHDYDEAKKVAAYIVRSPSIGHQERKMVNNFLISLNRIQASLLG